MNKCEQIKILSYDEQFVRDFATSLKVKQSLKLEKRNLQLLRNNYAGARTGSNLLADWKPSVQLASDEVLRWQLNVLRDRCRDLAENNDYAKNFLRKLKINVVGENGFILQPNVKLANGEPDKPTNDLIVQAWNKWCKKQYASACGTMSFNTICNLVVTTTAMDGEILVRKVKGFKNDFRFALQLLEGDYLDLQYNLILPNSNLIIMGIEKDQWGKPINYHLWSRFPGGSLSSTPLMRIPTKADDIIHIFIKERASQSRGVPWMHTAIITLRMLGGYQEAELVASRVSSAKMGFLIPPEGKADAYKGDDTEGAEEVRITEVEPGMLELLPPGFDMRAFDVNSPNANFQNFNKAILRSASAGIGQNYNSLASDLEGVNFSSLRAGTLEERDMYKVLQGFFIGEFVANVYEEWLPMAIMSKQLPLNFSDIETRFMGYKFIPRRWDWVDPKNDVDAKAIELQNGLTTRTRICSEQGDDFAAIVAQLKEEKRMLDEAGIVLGAVPIPVPAPIVPKNPATNKRQELNLEYSMGGNGRNGSDTQ